MDSILKPSKLEILVESFRDKKIVLVGGCFDILHLGHISLLENAKKQGDILIVILESDRKIRALKGPKRPINSQINRAKVLAALRFVDFVILLPNINKSSDYDQIVKQINPDIVATTKGDPSLSYKQRAAKLVGAKVKEVTTNITSFSSSNLIKEII